MAPTRKVKRNSTGSTSPKLSSQTPKKSTKTQTMITQRQKQALIDNLQLEITDRARRLRGLYARQAQSLQNRIEMRINRIPTSLRKVTMGELLEKHSKPDENEKEQPITEKPAASKAPKLAPTNSSKPTTIKQGLKRTSDVMEDDKENTPDLNQYGPAPKKRAKAGEGRVPNPATVLSPKSSNSRTIPQSPIRSQLASTQKGAQARPVSPLKSTSPAKAAASTTLSVAGSANTEKARAAKSTTTTANTRKPATRAVAEVKPYTARTKRGLAVTGGVDRNASSSSNTSAVSGTSAGTTIVKRVGRALTSTTTTKKTTSTAVAQKTTRTKATAATGTAKRSLRKRAV